MRTAPTRAIALFLFIANLVLLPLSHTLVRSNASDLPFAASSHRLLWLTPNNLGVFVRKLVDGRAVCLEAGTEQAAGIRERDPDQPLTAIEPDPSHNRRGLTIKLRGTSQLRGFPQATEAFRRAADRWEAVIQSRLTIVIDVDFGPTLFGKPFDENVVGRTDAQVLAGNALYPAARAALIAQSVSSQKASLRNSLPARTVPTDGGESAAIAASSATLRALSLVDPIVDPVGELSSFGPPPAIGLNSKLSFDFEPEDGIAQDKLDFEAIALHEIGHILGFISCVGQQEINSSIDVQCSIWDLFRGRPDEIRSGFALAKRTLHSGGEQSFYAGDEALQLSTGRPDGTGGDARQPAHWKDDSLTGRYIGIMDPTIGPGESHFITDKDAAVLEAIGYRVNAYSPFLTPLFSGEPETGGMPQPPANLGFLSHLQYSIPVPPGAAQLRIELNGNQDVDLYVRFGERVFIQGFHPVSDHVSAGESNFEAITITPSSSPPLRAGVYFIAVANFGPGDADFTVTATVTGGVGIRAPAIFSVTPRLEGDLLNLAYAATDLDGDVIKADLAIVDESGRTVGQPKSVAIISGGSTLLESQLSIAGLSAERTATGARLVLIDRDGNSSPEVIVDFSRAEAGGLTIKSASFDGSRLTIKTSGVVENLEVEINGVVVAPPRAIKVKGSGGKVIVKGDAGQLGLGNGANRIRIRNTRGWSNILIFDN
jgi:hypothetical protein